MKKILLILVCIILSGGMYAQNTSTWQVTPQQALVKAESFLAKKRMTTNATNRRIVRSRTNNEELNEVNISEQNENSTAPYYVFNVGNQQGFVIVSGDSRVEAILGYSESGDFTLDSIPENMREWLNGYKDAISSIENKNVPINYTSTASTLINKSAIAPILTTQWSQSEPFNAQAPEYQGIRCLTGCVATAMAQVMNHLRWPQSSTSIIPSYKTNVQIGDLESLPSTTFNWDVIATGTGTAYEAEVAKLMRYCGQSVKMNYGTGASSASTYYVAPAFSNYFGYKDAKTISRESYSVSEWDEMIYNEIANNRAVYYDGQSTGGGHAFVVDGYDGNGLFHINWGWSGYCDGYFKLSVLNPYSNSGYGASSSNDGYSMSQHAVIGLGAGDNILEDELRCTSLSCYNTSLHISYYNDSHNSSSYSYGVAIMDNYGRMNLIGNASSATFASEQTMNLSVNVASYLTTQGTYTVVPVYRRNSTDSWKRTADHKKYATITVSSDFSLSITTHPIQQLSLEGLSVDGDHKLGSEQVLKFSVRNTGDDYSGTVYCFISSTDDKGKYISRAGIAVESGAVETVDIYITPPEAGKLNVWLATDYMGNNVIGKTALTITSEQTEPSSLSISYNDVETGNGFAKTTFYLQNDGRFTYGRPILVELTDAVTNEVERTSTMNDVSIESGSERGWWIRFSGLDNSKIYYFNIYYYAEVSGSEKKLAGKVKVVMPEASVSATHNLSITVSKGGSVYYSGNSLSEITSSYEIVDGSSVNLTLKEDEGYRLKSLEVNGNNVTSDITNDVYTILNIKMDQIVKVTFEPIPTLTIKQSEKGFVKIVVEHEKKCIIKFCPDKEKKLVSVQFNGQDVTKQVTSENLYTTPNITGDSMIEVLYGLNDSPNIIFADANVKALCVANWDTNGDGELSQAEAAAVTDVGTVFKNESIKSFNEFQYFIGVKSIGSSAFSNCSGLTSITIPNSVTSIGSSAFSGCSGLTSITIPNSVTSIGSYAFSGCSGLTSITIPNSVTSIGNYAFRSCSGLISIKVEDGNPKYDSRNNCNAIIQKSNNSLIVGCKNTVIPNSVTNIGEYAFSECYGLTSITIPNSVTSIGSFAFSWCI